MTPEAKGRSLPSGDISEGAIVGETPVMRGLLARLEVIARAEGPVLVSGETGTGKELWARALHRLGPRATDPFTAIDCATEGERFGAALGTTGPCRGTLFLDEPALLSADAQARLLRFLEDGGASPELRCVSATRARLGARARAGDFRIDLFYRLERFRIELPPLRERMDDLALLIEHVCRDESVRGPVTIRDRAWRALERHAFPGNLRELRHAICHALALAGGADIDLEHLPDDIRRAVEAEPEPARTLAEAEAEFERAYLENALRCAGWNRTRAARRLGISRKTLWQKLRRHGIEPP